MFSQFNKKSNDSGKQVVDFYLNTLIVLVAVCAASSAFSSGVSEVSGVIPNGLPRASTADFAQINYPKPSEMAISTTQYCGDGDVAHYASSHKNVDFVTNGDVKFVLGYWNSPTPISSGSTKFIPTTANWNTLGYIDSLKSDGGNSSEFKDFDTGDTIKSMYLVNKAINTFKTYKGYTMPAGKSNETHATYLGVLMCKDFQTDVKTGVKAKDFLDLYGQNLAFNTAYANVKKSVEAGNLTEAGKYTVAVSGSSPKLSVGASGKSNVSSHPFFQIANALKTTNYPGKSGSGRTSAINLAKYLASAKDCSSVSGVTNQKYWWEHVPQGAACKALGNNYISAVTSMFALTPGTDVPAKEEYEALKVQLMSQLISAAIIDSSQNDFHKLTANSRANVSCVPAGGRYVDKIMGSIVLDMSAGTSSYSMIHPEGNFAIGGDAPYRSNAYAIFNMSGKGRPVLMNSGDEPKVGPVSSKALHLKFNVRGVGCSKNVYCNLDELFNLGDRS